MSLDIQSKEMEMDSEYGSNERITIIAFAWITRNDRWELSFMYDENYLLCTANPSSYHL